MLELNKIYNEDCLEGMKKIDDNSIDLIVTDPPYGYSFMGKDWDKAVPSVEIWKECLRILKHGSFCFVMSAPRSDVQSEMVKRLEKAGFRIDFTPIYWAYASGFPKAGNISKLVDKRLGAEREIIGKKECGYQVSISKTRKEQGYRPNETNATKEVNITKPATLQAKALDGSYAGFQPKPAVEIIIVAMKPLSEKTYVDQAMKNQKGITWLDDCRIPYENEGDKPKEVTCSKFEKYDGSMMNLSNLKNGEQPERTDWKWKPQQGRFPANLIVSDDILNDGKMRGSKTLPIRKTFNTGGTGNVYTTTNDKIGNVVGKGDIGSFSRYFDLDEWFRNKLKGGAKKTFPFLIVPKASKGEKNEGLEIRETEKVNDGRNTPIDNPYQRGETERKNIHPTVKPIKLMSYLITLGSRRKDIVYDPFIGSGTTLIASRKLGRNCIGFEISEEYCKIANERIKKELSQKRLFEW